MRNSVKQFAFALTSDGSDPFCAMTAVSANAVRRLHRDASVVVAMDERTCDAGVADLPWWPKGTRFLRIDTAIADRMGRNRFVKTTLRAVLNGPFVYLDGDALPVRPLDGLFERDADFAGVPNRYRGAVYAQFPPESVSEYAALGWPLPSGPYLNGGVWYCGGGPAAMHFGTLYHEQWLAFAKSTGSYRDQPSLNAALDAARGESGLRVDSLPLRYNAMVDLAPCFAQRAHVWHFYTRDNSPPTGSLLAELVDGLRAHGVIDWTIFDDAVTRNAAWSADAKWHMKYLEQYLRDGQAAVDAGDFEVAWRMAAERLRQRPLSPRTWRMVVHIAFAQAVRRRRAWRAT